MVNEDGMESGTGMLKPGTLWDLPQYTLWYIIPKSHGTAVGNAGQPSSLTGDEKADLAIPSLATCVSSNVYN